METKIVHPSARGQLFVLDGKEIKPVRDVVEWNEWMKTADRKVAFHKIGDIEVSTVFLGQNQSFFIGPLLLFETKIFGGEHDGKTWYYSTWEEAEKGHKKACELVTVL